MKKGIICLFFMLLAMGVFCAPNAKATSKTQADAINWVKSQVGKGIDWDGLYGNQCVDLIKAYYNYLGGGATYGNGADYASNALPAGWNRYQGAQPQAGDILVYTGGYGHVAIYESDRSHYHQNFDGHPYVERITYMYNGLSSTFWGVIRPNWGGGDAASISFSDQRLVSSSDNNAVVYAKINNPNRMSFSKVGCYLYNEGGTLIKTYDESCTLSTSYVNYNCDFNTDMKYTLSPGTNYKYVLYAVVGGKEYKDTMRSFKTTGTAPAAKSLSFRNQNINSVSESNAEVYVYIDNPQKMTVSRVGCNLYGSDGSLIKSYYVECGLSTSYINYTCNMNKDAGITLSPSTSYKYELFAVADGKEYKDSARSFTTNKKAEVAPTVAPSSPAPTTTTITGDLGEALMWALETAENDSHGYSQSTDRRWGNPDYDCSSFIITAFSNGGFNVSGAVNTKNIRSVFEAAGFTWIPRGQIDLSTSADLMMGDILLNEGVHTEIYAGYGLMMGAHGGTYSIYDENNPGDDNGEEISVVSYSDKNWDGVLRICSSDSSGSRIDIQPTPSPIAKPSAAPTTSPKPSQTPIATKTPTPLPEASHTPQKENSVGSTKIKTYTKSKKAIEITYSKAKNASGYQIMISTNASFSGARTIWTSKTKKKITGLKRKTKYYIRVRGYDFETYGKWSAKKTLKTK